MPTAKTLVKTTPSRLYPNRRLFLRSGSATVVLAALAAITGCSRRNKNTNPLLAKDSVILCLGDSLTYGFGITAPEQSYPSRLEALTGHVTKNAGINGDRAEGALARLPELLQASTPRLVLVSIGGNDFLRGVPLEQTRAALVGIVSIARAANAQVALIAQPRPVLMAAAIGSLEDHPVYAEVASETATPLFRQGWSDVLSKADWRSDQIHANSEGYRVFTEKLADWLRDQGWVAKN